MNRSIDDRHKGGPTGTRTRADTRREIQGLPGVGLTVVLPGYDVLEQLPSSDPATHTHTHTHTHTQTKPEIHPHTQTQPEISTHRHTQPETYKHTTRKILLETVCVCVCVCVCESVRARV